MVSWLLLFAWFLVFYCSSLFFVKGFPLMFDNPWRPTDMETAMCVYGGEISRSGGLLSGSPQSGSGRWWATDLFSWAVSFSTEDFPTPHPREVTRACCQHCGRQVRERRVPLNYRVDPKLHMAFFHRIKDTSFIFTNNFIDLDILSMSALSRMV